jgi:predicted CXXCH cytochrome family protein
VLRGQPRADSISDEQSSTSPAVWSRIRLGGAQSTRLSGATPAARISWVAALAFALLSQPGAGQESSGPRRPQGPTDACVTRDCHGDIVTRRFVHGPSVQRKCDACHAPRSVADHTFDLTRPADELCETCHLLPREDYVHQPVREGACTRCHDPHGSTFRFMLLADPAEELCLRCHPLTEYESRQFVHGPVAAGACILCHEPHGSWRAHLLVSEGKEICLTCHSQVQERLAHTRHPHRPVAEGLCSACHDPHASDNRMQLRDEPGRLCLRCHSEIAQLISTAKYVHGAVLDAEACSHCHFAHGTDLPQLLRQPLMEICLGCHDRRMQAASGEMLEDMAAVLRENPNHHGPVRNGDCSACHNPHASANFCLLVHPYPPEFYAPFAIEDYDLCFTCHLREMVLVQYGRGITGFAQQTNNGLLNLHYVHVNRKEKGRTCRACHEVHASKRPAHIRESVPFGPGQWPLEINFTQSEDGGSCAPGCHKPQAYHRSPADVGGGLRRAPS